jgi:hypothetical protein
MYLVLSSNRRSVCAGQTVELPNQGSFEVVNIKRPTTKLPQGEVSLKGTNGQSTRVTPREINAEWIA